MTTVEQLAKESAALLRHLSGVNPDWNAEIMARGYLVDSSSLRREIDIKEVEGVTWITMKEEGKTVVAWSYRDYRTIDDHAVSVV